MVFSTDQLAWLVYAIGTITSGQTSSGGTRRDEQLELDAKLIAIVFQFLSMSNTRVSLFSPSGVPLNAHVDKAFIHFFQCFRRVHIGFEGYSRTGGWDQSSDPEIFFKISDQLGRQTTQNDVLSEILRKV